MKNKISLLLVVLAIMLFLPLGVKAVDISEYKTLNFKEALADEGIEEAFSNYVENDDAITIYLFRGKGCGYCQRFLNFLNSITDDYGKFFKVVSFESWNDSNNSALLKEVSTFLDGSAAGGVPYIIIGDKTFVGYATEYDDSIKSAIIDLYNTDASKRYDVFVAMESEGRTSTNDSKNTSNTTTILFSLLFVALGTICVIGYETYRFNKLSEEIALIKKETKATSEKSKSKK